MEDYLSEREQVDRIRQWWKENGAWIIVGVGGGVLALALWNWWQGYQVDRAEQASAIYSVVTEAALEDRIDEIRVGVEQLESGHASSPYLQHARLALAGAAARNDEPGVAIDQLQQVMEDADDPQLKLVARLRLARMVLTTGDPGRALELARGVEAGAFTAPLKEVEGDALAAQGDASGAREAYQAALAGAAQYGGIVDEGLLQLKLKSLATDGAATDGAATDGDAS